MPEHRDDIRSPLGKTYLRETYRQERGRDGSLAGDVGERILYYTLVGTAAVLTLASASRLARKITR